MITEELYANYLLYPNICIDTRKIAINTLFFCLKGSQTNGNQYAQEAIRLGASYVVMDDPLLISSIKDKNKVIQVDDCLTALQDLAKLHRSKLKIPIIGITGSNGKTTTKEILKYILSEKYSTFSTEGNLNNHIGVPISILSIRNYHEIGIIEMGANHQKEIEFLCTISQPDFGIITNIGKAHLEGFGGIEGIMKGKKELYDYLSKNEGVAFIYSGDQRLMQMIEALDRKYYYGTHGNEWVTGKVVKEFPEIEVSWKTQDFPLKEYTAKTHLAGAYNLPNILAGVTIGHYFKIKGEKIAKGIEKYKPHNSRSEIKKIGENIFILDFYNANPDSMREALLNFADFPSKHKMVIIGDMFELGEDSYQEHNTIASLIEGMHFDIKVLIGENFYPLQKNYKNMVFAENLTKAINWFKNETIKNFAILIKGSRGMKMETLMPLFNS